MIIYSKDREILLNFEHAIELFVSSRDGVYSIVARATNGNNLIMGKYDTREQAKVALSKVFRQISLGKNVKIPEDNEVKAEIIDGTKDKQYHIAGKKIKGHGGS